MLKDFFDLVFPQCCITCNSLLNQQEKYLCISCKESLPTTELHLTIDNFLSQRFKGRVPFVNCWSYLHFSKNSKTQKILHQLKYKGQENLSFHLGRWYATDLKSDNVKVDYDLILPVALHSSKLKIRGYNQSDGFAKGISEVLEIPFLSNQLRRDKMAITQTKLSRINRWRNVENSFSIKDKYLFKNKKVLIVDDVVTTGATLESVAKLVLDSAASTVGFATIAAAQ